MLIKPRIGDMAKKDTIRTPETSINRKNIAGPIK
jgi:hypothetical protein